MYYAWCIAKGDGTHFQANSEWMTYADKKSYKESKDALTKIVSKLLRESGFGAPGAPVDPTDPSVARRTRSATTNGGKVGAVRQLTQEELDALPPPLPKGACGVEEEKLEVAQDGRLSSYPVLLPKNGVVLTHEPMEQAQWPSLHLGNVRVQKMVSLTVTTAKVATAGKFR